MDTLSCDFDLEGDFFVREEYKDLYDKIKSLEEKDVVLIKLKYWEGLSDKKIGEIMNLAPKTIRNRHSMALKRLRAMYGCE